MQRPGKGEVKPANRSNAGHADQTGQDPMAGSERLDLFEPGFEPYRQARGGPMGICLTIQFRSELLHRLLIQAVTAFPPQPATWHAAKDPQGSEAKSRNVA